MTHDAIHSWLIAAAPALRDHVVDSTVFLLALLAISMLPFLRSRTRHALVVVGVARFFVPGAVISAIGEKLTGGAVDLPSLSVTAALGLQPPAAPRSEALCIAAALWLTVGFVLMLRFFAAMLRWRRLARTATPASVREVAAMQVAARRSRLRQTPPVARSAGFGPLTAGFLRPVVLLPDSCAAVLDDDELTAVLAHELGHVERRHNLALVLLGFATSAFWFHPVLWIAASRLRTEAEQDCDERALDFVSDPPRYFAGLLKVCHGFIAPQPAGVSCMSTTRLKERMDHMIRHRRTQTRPVSHQLALGLALAALLLTTLFASAGEPAKANAKDDDVTLPKLLTSVQPAYPESARKARVQGLVVVAADISAKGIVTAASVVQGIEGEEGKALEASALAAVKQWTFEPALKKGKPVAITYKVTVNFKLDGSSGKSGK